MLAIRMQRTGRKGHAMFRVIVQDSRRTPTSGKVVAYLGSYDPHAKTAVLDKDKAGSYLKHGAQPSDRVARLLKSEGVKLPAWVKLAPKKKAEVRNPDKRRSTRPEGAEAPVKPETPAETAKPVEETPVAEASVSESAEKPEAAEESAAEETAKPEAETDKAEETAPQEEAGETTEKPEETADASTETPADTPAEK